MKEAQATKACRIISHDVVNLLDRKLNDRRVFHVWLPGATPGKKNVTNWPPWMATQSGWLSKVAIFSVLFDVSPLAIPKHAKLVYTKGFCAW